MTDTFPKIIILNGPEEGKEFPLRGSDSFSIGRLDENDVVLSDTSVSRYHSTLIFKNGKWQIRDERSRNGTFVNENRLEAGVASVLANLDEIRIGIYDLRFIEREATHEEIEKQAGYAYQKRGGDERAQDKRRGETAGRDGDAEGEEKTKEESLDSDRDELQQALTERPIEAPRLSRGIKVFILIAAVFALLGVGLYFAYEHFSEGPSGQDGVAAGIAAELGAGTRQQRPAPDTPAEIPGEPVERGATLAVDEEPTYLAQPLLDLAPDEPGRGQFRVFLDVKTEPLPATVYFNERRLGIAPLKESVLVRPNETYEVYADFELREINDIYRKKVVFKTRPDTDVIELTIDGEIGVLKILKLPRRVDFYLEGYYEYDKLRANPVKLSDIVYGKPIYLPYGKYIVELREKTKVAGSDNFITQIRYQREYHVGKDNRILELKVTDRDLNFFPAIIRSNPSHATVYFGGEKVGTTPYKGLLPIGSHKLKVIKEGYFASVIDVDMRMNSVYETTVTLKTSRMGELINQAKESLRHDRKDEAVATLVEALKYGGSARERAEVYYLLGTTYLSQKQYDLAIPYFDKASSHKAYRPQALLGLARVYHRQNQPGKALKTVVAVLAGIDSKTPNRIRQEANAVFKLISPVKSVLYIYTDPPGAHVFVNEKRIQQDTPLILSDLALGNYRLQFEKPGYETYKTRQNLKVGEFVMLKVKLTPEKI